MKLTALTLSLIALSTLSVTAHAVDGEILITQAKAMAGNVTPGDAPGFPISINMSGKYKLAGNLVMPNTSVNGIEISAPNVTLDLNGFGLFGPNECTGQPVTSCSENGTTNTGILGGAHVTVLNGTIRGTGFRGIQVGGHARLEGVDVSHHSNIGILIYSGIVRNSRSSLNWSNGLLAERNTVVTGSVFSHNMYGIVAGSDGGVLISGNSIYNNDKWGILGYGPLSSGYSNNVLFSNGSGSAKDIKDLGGNL